MRSYQQAFNTGETRDFIVDAKYFFLFDANSAVTVQFWKGGAPSDDLALNILSGFKCRPEKGFDRITITSSAAQTISFFITKGEGDYDRFVGNVNVLGYVALDAAALAAIQNRNLGFTYGASYKSTTAMGANTPDVIFTPASNVNGAILHSAQFQSGNNSGVLFTTAILAKASAPANINDGDGILSVDNVTMASGLNYYSCASLKNAVRIPAGKGLYFISSIVENVSNRSALYTLL